MPRKIHVQDPEKLAFWRSKIEEQQSSGLTQAEFCRQNNLTENKFSFWKGVIFPEARLVHPRTRIQKRNRVHSPVERERLIKKWEKSGLTQAEFCRQEHIFEWQFSDWKNRRKRTQKKAATSRAVKPSFVEVDLLEKKVAKKKQGQSEFIQENGGGKSKVVAEIHFAGGSISIFSDACMVDVKNIVTALSECERDRTK